MIKPIAFYLPQFHPIPENNEWWGNGFTEWTNVAKAKPLFKGHYQPRLPADLGFYDLRIPEVREQQANLARENGVYGFCYWHYWFGDGRKILERPFTEVLESGKPDFPFCLAWANESWTGIWHGNPKNTLVEQLYPGKNDYINHFNYLLKAFEDRRYIKVEDKPLFVVYQPNLIPDLSLFTNIFTELSKKNGFPGMYLVATNVQPDWNAKEKGFDAVTLSHHSRIGYTRRKNKIEDFFQSLKHNPTYATQYKKAFGKPVHIYEYSEAMKYFIADDVPNSLYYPMLIPNWDNTPRSGVNGFVLHNSTPELFKWVVEKAVKRIEKYDDEHKIIFIKSWNEWAEGNYLEPDMKYGHQYLEVLKDVIRANS